MEGLILNGEITVEGMTFTSIEGGFGEGKKAMLVKDIANIHKQTVSNINLLINDNRKRFKDFVDIIDLKKDYSAIGENNSENSTVNLSNHETKEFVVHLVNSGIFTQNAINASKNIYILSERGYSKLLKLLEDDLAWDQYGKLVDGYFEMRKEQKTGSEFDTTSNNLEKLKLEQQGFKFAMEFLKPSKASTVKMLKTFYESQNLTTSYLPVYVDDEAGTSLTDLLKKFEVGISTVRFNKLLLEKGYLTEEKRSSTNKDGFKKYKKLTDLGLLYGKNDICIYGTEKQTNPLYYKSKFQELVSIVLD